MVMPRADGVREWASLATATQTDVELMAVLGEVTMRLSEVIDWKVGTQILLNTPPDGQIALRCGERPLCHGRMGRKGGMIAVQVESESILERPS